MTDFGILLGLAYQRFVDELRAHLAGNGFTDLGRSDGYVIRIVSRSPVTINELAVAMGVTKQAAAQVVADMDARGYLRRVPDPDDRRAQRLHLTDRGTQLLNRARRFHATYEREAARHLGQDRLQTTRAVLTELSDGADNPRQLRAW
ncbi:MAG TPA: MarR family transcriptional regulator [Pseudonocardiaceae bacterium]|nr:MarR family transcriptional regulator [Pseudonocardiaceae bacterium]